MKRLESERCEDAMWHAISRRKVDRVLSQQAHGDVSLAAWRAIVDRAEDLLTSGVFERLSYLPEKLATEIVMGASQPMGLRTIPIPLPVVKSHPWPQLSSPSGFIEPDWVWETVGYTLIIEAKWGVSVVPDSIQLERQASAARLRWRGRLIHLVVVQSGMPPEAVGRECMVLSWAALRHRVVSLLKNEGPFERGAIRILEDVLQILDARGLSFRDLASLPALEIPSALMRRWRRSGSLRSILPLEIDATLMGRLE